MPKHNPAPHTERRDMPMHTREAPVVATDVAARTADLVWTTGARVRRYDYWNDRQYDEELSLAPEHVRMTRLQSGSAPLLNSHDTWSLDSVLGVVTDARLDGTEGRCTVKFSARGDVAPIVQDVADGIIRNVSVGYRVHRMERIAPAREGEPWIYRAIDWEPTEVSLVTVPADAGAGVRSADPRTPDSRMRLAPCEFVNPPAAAGTTPEERHMTEEEMRAAAAAEQTRNAEAAAERERIVKEARAAEAARQAEIRELARIGNVPDSFADTLLRNADMTAEQAGIAILREQARVAAQNPTRSASSVHVQAGADERDNRRAVVGAALRLRAAPATRLATDEREHRDLSDAARQYRGHTLMDLARDAIEQVGGNIRGMSRREIAQAAMNLDRDAQVRAGMHGTSDFPEILANTVGRTLRAAYVLSERTFTPWARRSTAPDFKQIARTQLSEMTAFSRVNEGGEYKALSFGESAEKYSLVKYGGIVAITWETLINDDLSAFDRVPAAIAAEAAANESDIVYNILLANAAMADGNPLFHATHGNLPAGAAITDVTLGAGRALMYKQTGPKGRVLNLRPRFLIVGPDKEAEANKYTSANFVAAKSVDINPQFNTSLQVIVEARVTGNKWFLAAEPTLIDTVEYAYLEGEEGLFTETQQGFDVDGLRVKARQVFAAKAIDWRGLVYNSGA